MYDRNGELVVYNQPAYDVMLIPRDVQPFDTLDFCETIHITPEQLNKRFADMRDKRINPGYSSYTPQRLITQLSSQDYGRLQEKLYRFPGFFIQKRILRQYNYATAANVLGNLREVNQRDIEKDEYYAPATIQATWAWKAHTNHTSEVSRARKYLFAMLEDAFKADMKAAATTWKPYRVAISS